MKQVVAQDSRSTRLGAGRGHLVLGECVQGRLPDGLDFLITSPIGRCSLAHFKIDHDQDLTVKPANYGKSLRAVRQWLEEHDLPCVGTLEIETPLPSCHGFGTSSADITASLRAVADAWGRNVTPQEISAIAIGIEPTDGSMYPESVAYAHRSGQLLEMLGPLPSFTALVACNGEGVDTVAFDTWRSSHGLRYTEQEIQEFGMAWQMIREANKIRSASLLGKACMISARINQRILPKPFYPQMHEIVLSGIGEGLITAHSGSAIALLLDPKRPDFQVQRQEALWRLMEFAPDVWFELSNYTLVAPKPGDPVPDHYPECLNCPGSCNLPNSSASSEVWHAPDAEFGTDAVHPRWPV